MSIPVWKSRSNRLKRVISSGKPALVLWVTIPWAPVVEIAGAWGVDGIIIDLEHTTWDLESMEHAIVAAEAAGVTAMVRPPSLDSAVVGRVLDAGAQGVLFPRIEDGHDADSARRSLKHGRHGTRGWGGAHTRHAMWQGPSAIAGYLPAAEGVYSPEYVEKAAEDVLCGFLVESARGVANIEAILDAGEPDMVDFGRGDFSVEVDFDDDACDEAFSTVMDACRDRDIGMNVAPGQLATHFYPGCYSVIGLDALLLSRSIQEAVEGARALHKLDDPT